MKTVNGISQFDLSDDISWDVDFESYDECIKRANKLLIEYAENQRCMNCRHLAYPIEKRYCKFLNRTVSDHTKFSCSEFLEKK